MNKTEKNETDFERIENCKFYESVRRR